MHANQEQVRAKSALAQINRLKANEKFTAEGKFVSYVKSFPAMIHQNGLGQAVAFCRSKAKSDNKLQAEAYQTLYDILQAWLCQSSEPESSHTQPFSKSQSLTEAITNSELGQYQLAQTEAQLYLIWLKKFAIAILNHE